MENNIIPHTQLPNEMDDLTPEDKLIYLSIKRFQNHKTGKCFPLLNTIASVSNSSINYVKKIIDRLVKLGYISITKVGRSNYYTFKKYIKFEIFTDLFLDFEGLDFTTKAFLIAAQKYMFIDSTNTGKITYSNMELSNKINMAYRTIYDCQKKLKNLGLLTIVDTKVNGIGGCKEKLYLYNLQALGQLVYEIKHMNDRLNDHEEKLQNIDLNTESITKLEQEIAELKKTQTILLRALQAKETKKKPHEPFWDSPELDKNEQLEFVL